MPLFAVLIWLKLFLLLVLAVVLLACGNLSLCLSANFVTKLSSKS